MQRTSILALLGALSLVFSVACGGDSDGSGGATSGAAGGGAGGMPAQGGSSGAGAAAGSGDPSAGSAGSGGATDPPALPSLDYCERILAGPGGEKSLAVDLSAAHAGVRFFGVETSHEKVDLALAAALEQPSAPDAVVAAYAKQLGFACALPAENMELPEARVDLVGEVAVLRPGTGDVALPPGARAIAIDLRGLPSRPELRAALEKAASLALGEAVARPKLEVREHRGLTDEVYAPTVGISNVYSSVVAKRPQEPLPAGPGAGLPLAVLTAARLAPEAAQLAAVLRFSGRAWLLGEDVLTAVAEARWYGVGDSGLAHRDRVLLAGTKAYPDVIPADARSASPEQLVAGFVAQGSPSPLAAGEASRPRIEKFDTARAIEGGDPSPGMLRAALTTAHGGMRLFFPYFPVVGDSIDQGLDDEMAKIGDALGEAFVRPVYRLQTHLHDSHAFLFNFGPSQAPAAGGYLPLFLDESDTGETIVRQSKLDGVAVGEVILKLGDKPFADVLAAVAPFVPASNPGAATRDQLSASLYVKGDTTLELRDAAGKVRTVSVPASALAKSPGSAVSARKHGSLADLGAPDLYYINLDGPVFTGPLKATDVMAEASSAKGLVIDARGYPGSPETWDVIRRILKTESFIKLNVDTVTTIDRKTVPQDQLWSPLGAPRYDGAVVVIVGPWTQSQAEHILMPLVNEKRATILGRPSAGANGNITGLMLPGKLGVTFTGMEVRFADGSTFHGHGIVPDVELRPSQQSLSAATPDPELLEAISLLTPLRQPRRRRAPSSREAQRRGHAFSVQAQCPSWQLHVLHPSSALRVAPLLHAGAAGTAITAGGASADTPNTAPPSTSAAAPTAVPRGNTESASNRAIAEAEAVVVIMVGVSHDATTHRASASAIFEPPLLGARAPSPGAPPPRRGRRRREREARGPTIPGPSAARKQGAGEIGENRGTFAVWKNSSRARPTPPRAGHRSWIVCAIGWGLTLR